MTSKLFERTGADRVDQGKLIKRTCMYGGNQPLLALNNVIGWSKLVWMGKVNLNPFDIRIWALIFLQFFSAQ